MYNDSGAGQGGDRPARSWWTRRTQAKSNSWDQFNDSGFDRNRTPERSHYGNGVESRMPGENLADGFHAYAGFMRRLFSFLIDGIFLSAILSISSAVSGSHINGTSGIAVLINFIYFVGLIGGPAGQTIGSKLLKIRVISVTGTTVGYPRALARQLFSILSGIILLAGYFMMLVTRKKQTLHDLLAGTVVIMVQGIQLEPDPDDVFRP